MFLRPKLLFASLIFFASALVVCVYILVLDNKNTKVASSNYEKEIGDFVLTDYDGKKVALSQFRGELVLLFFGYTHCPDICPAALGKLKKVYNEFGSGRADLRVLFISIDPDRDSIQKLKSHLPVFHHEFVGLTGTDEELSRVAKMFGVAYFKEDNGINHTDDYLMNHPTSIFLISRDGKLVSRYSHSSSVKSLVRGIREHL